MYSYLLLWIQMIPSPTSPKKELKTREAGFVRTQAACRAWVAFVYFRCVLRVCKIMPSGFFCNELCIVLYYRIYPMYDYDVYFCWKFVRTSY